MYLLEFGGEDDAFAAHEAANAAVGIRRIAPGLGLAGRIVPDRIRGLAFTRRASELVARTDAAVESARIALETAIGATDRRGSVAVRATDVYGTTGVDTVRAERVLGQVLVDHGFSVDLERPDHVLRAAFSADTRRTGRSDSPASGGNQSVRSSGNESPTTDGLGVPMTGDVTQGRAARVDGDESASVCALGWQIIESVRDFGARKPTEKPFFQPGSMDPLLARAVANMAGAGPGTTILDPMCGTGGVLIEAGLVGATVIGSDAQEKMVAGARVNLHHYLTGATESTGDEFSSTASSTSSPTVSPSRGVSASASSATDHVGGPPGGWHVCRADATRLPVVDCGVDAVLLDAPYGRQSKIESHDLDELVSGTLSEARRVASRAVVVADRPLMTAARNTGWTLEATFERRVHRSLVRYVHVLSPSDVMAQT